MSQIKLVEMYKLFLEYIPFPSWIETVDYKIVFLNKACENMLGIELSKVKDQTNKEIFNKKISQEYNRQVNNCINSKKTIWSEYIINGNYIHYCMFPILNEVNQVIAVAGILIDIDQDKEIMNKREEYFGCRFKDEEISKYTIIENICDCIKNIEVKAHRQNLLEDRSISSLILESYRKLLKVKNIETNMHTDRVVKYVTKIGEKLNLELSDLNELILSAELHDIGKIGIPDNILSKPDKLTDEEFKIMKTHTEKGYRIINSLGELDNVAKSVLTHHEKWDGSGYPLGLKQTDIPLFARIIAVADSYDAMVNERIYKKAMKEEDAINELIRCSGTQFDPTIVKVFVDNIEEIRRL